ncbi:MAG: nucleotidyltransferase [Nitrospirae bacterium RBG_13_41_22]|nr:MAG: nucleotidyltransferase [Nitrospirae bacterium RBG_13_41_22]
MRRMKIRKDLTEKEILSLLRKNSGILKKYKVKRIGLFGSYVRGEQKRRSDIDFLVEFDMTAFDENFRGLFDYFMDLSSYLENLFGKKVDILTPVSVDSIRIKEVSEEIKRSVIYA